MNWYYMLICTSIIPIMITLLGILMLKVSYKSKQSYYGYRSKLAMMNKDTWEFAQKTAGALWIKIGIGALVVSVVIMLIVRNYDQETLSTVALILCIVEVLFLAFGSYPVEKKLKDTFDQNGVRK